MPYLEITQLPSSPASGAGLPTGSTFIVRAANDDTTTNTTNRVITLSVTGGTGGTLRGPTSQQTVSGIATFRGVSLQGAGLTAVVTAATAGYTSAVSSAISIGAAVDTFFRNCALPRSEPTITRFLPSGTTRYVGAGQTYTTIQAAVNAAARGDEIVLKDGNTFAEDVVIPNLAASGTTWVTIRSETMPCAEGERAWPADFTTQAIWRPATNNGSAFSFAENASYWRIEGVHVQSYRTGTPNTRVSTGSCVILGNDNGTSTVNHIVLDRSYIEGSDTYWTRRGAKGDCAHGAIINSTIDKFHDGFTDSQDILILASSGPFLVQNNNLHSGCSENFMAGGASVSASVTPRDITFRYNYVKQPASYIGVYTDRKNLFELKTCHRCLVEYNIFEGFAASAQPYAINLKSVDQDNLNPDGGTADVVFRYNLIRGVAGVFSLAGNPQNTATERMSRVCIWQNLCVDINPTAYPSDGTNHKHVQFGAVADLEVAHNTFVGAPGRDGHMARTFVASPFSSERLIFRDNLSLGYGLYFNLDGGGFNMNAVLASTAVDAAAIIEYNGGVGTTDAPWSETNSPASNIWVQQVSSDSPDPGFATYSARTGAFTADPLTLCDAFTITSGVFNNTASDGTDIGCTAQSTIRTGITGVIEGTPGAGASTPAPFMCAPLMRLAA